MPASAGLSQLGLVQRERCCGDAARVQRIGLADVPVRASVHPRGLDDGVSGVCGNAREPCTIGARALDHPQYVEVTAGAAPDPRRRP